MVRSRLGLLLTLAMAKKRKPKVSFQFTEIPFPFPILGLRSRDTPATAIDPRALVDCDNVEIMDRAVRLVKGWTPFEAMAAALPDFQGPIALLDELAKFDGSTVGVAGTPNDLYKRISFGVFDFITPVYNTGTAAISAADPPIVTGTGTTFVGNIGVGDRFRIDAQGAWQGVDSVDSNTQLTLVAGVYPGSPHAAQAYTVRNLFQAVAMARWMATVFKDEILMVIPGTEIRSWDGVTATVIKPASAFGTLEAAIINTYSNRPIVGKTVEAGVRFPQRVRWPENGTNDDWVVAAGKEAGFLDITEGADWMQGLYQLGNYMVAYKERSVHLLNFVGTPFIFGRRQVISGIGLLAPRAVADLGDEHFFFGSDNIYSFNGMSLKAIGTEVIDEIIALMDPTKLDEVIAWVIEEHAQVQFIVPLSAGGYKAYTYHFDEEGDVWTKRDLPSTAVGFHTQQEDIKWNQLDIQWTEYPPRWSDRDLLGFFPLNIFGDVVGRIWTFGTIDSENGVAIEGHATFGGFGMLIGDEAATDLIKELAYVDPWADTGLPGHKMKVQVLTEGRLGRGFVPSSSGEYQLDGSGHEKVSFRESGKAFSIKFATPDAPQVGNIWVLNGYGVGISIRGRRGIGPS